jgi:hypothetical protein
MFCSFITEYAFKTSRRTPEREGQQLGLRYIVEDCGIEDERGELMRLAAALETSPPHPRDRSSHA